MVHANELSPIDRAIYDEVTAGVEITKEVHAGAILLALANNGLVRESAASGPEIAGITIMRAAGTVVWSPYLSGAHYYLPASQYDRETKKRLSAATTP